MSSLERVLTNPPSLLFIWLTLLTVIPALAGIWYQLRVKELEISLKQSMVDRGMSAEEIKMVLEANSPRALVLQANSKPAKHESFSKSDAH